MKHELNINLTYVLIRHVNSTICCIQLSYFVAYFFKFKKIFVYHHKKFSDNYYEVFVLFLTSF